MRVSTRFHQDLRTEFGVTQVIAVDHKREPVITKLAKLSNPTNIANFAITVIFAVFARKVFYYGYPPDTVVRRSECFQPCFNRLCNRGRNRVGPKEPRGQHEREYPYQ